MILDTRYKIPDTRYKIPDTRYQISVFRIIQFLLIFKYPASGIKYPVSLLIF